MAQKKRSEKRSKKPNAGKTRKVAPTASAPEHLTPEALHAMAFSSAGEPSILIVGGTVHDAGAVVLASIAALRAGATSVEVATARETVGLVTAVVPQARGIGLDSRRSGSIAAASSRRVADRAKRVRAVVLGPGMRDGREAERFLGRVVARLDPKQGPILVLDGDVLAVLGRFPDLLRRINGRVIVTTRRSQLPNLAREMTGKTADDILGMARAAAREWRAVVAVTEADGGGLVVAPDGRAATVAGTLAAPIKIAGAAAGLVAAFAARGADPYAAAAWGLFVGARAAARVTDTIGHQGFLASELLAEIPRELEDLAT